MKNVKITKDTECCISIASSPGNFGSNFFNMAFEQMSLDYIYKPLRVEAKDLAGAIAGVRAFKIRGCGVSMPHKQKVLKYLDEINEVAKKIGAVNTIVNDNGRLIGYNTDYLGALAVLKEIPQIKNKSVLVIGAGGASRAIIMALKKINPRKITITNRNEARGKAIAKEMALLYYPYIKRGEIAADILINATPVGMSADDKPIMDKDALKRYETVIDVVVSSKKTPLINMGEKLNLKIIPGFKISIHQALVQFKLYTGVEVPINIVKRAIRSYLK